MIYLKQRQQFIGKLDIFLTMTCNPNWPEIKELQFNQETQNRLDLIVCIFRSKLEELKIELFKKRIFGRIVAYVYVIEFQKKRSTTCLFLLLFLKQIQN